MTSHKIDYLGFLKTVGKSKRLLRSGWVREKVKDPESIAEHSFRVGVLAMVLADKLGENLDKEKLIKMALVHDLGELITGDIVVERWDVIDFKKREQKEKEEREGTKKIFDKIEGADEYLAIYDEMVERNTEEARAFWQLDKLEMALQALEYEEEQGKNLEEFFLSVGLYYVQNPLVKEIFDKIVAARKRKK